MFVHTYDVALERERLSQGLWVKVKWLPPCVFCVKSLNIFLFSPYIIMPYINAKNTYPASIYIQFMQIMILSEKAENRVRIK